MIRRQFIAALGGLFVAHRAIAANPKDSAKIEKLELPEAEWRTRLSPDAFDVLRKEGTERPGSSPLNKEKRKGQYVCAGCDLALFESDTKYESGTGWPSFYDYIPGRLGTKTDFKLIYPRKEDR